MSSLFQGIGHWNEYSARIHGNVSHTANESIWTLTTTRVHMLTVSTAQRYLGSNTDSFIKFVSYLAE